MLIYVLDILLVLLQVFGIQASVEYFELSGNVLWDEAITLKNCNIALPAVTVKQNRYTVEIEHELRNREVWVGYYSMMTVFEYIGCVPINVAHATHMLPLEENGPGACYTLCRRSGKNTVGISQGKCFCIDKELENSYNNVECNLKCYKPIGLVCGGVKHMSVYRANLD
ncbi:uncharacterized protein LOC128551869, partial [Mercenaria mercenaria]|uniref:uncharacterized protein LOC128551869 n=1 Tax=Mercenaria mercenaria TaxID=6596 RepID=UPI00234F4300